MLLIEGGVVTDKIREALEKQKYAKKVRQHLAMSEAAFDSIDWKAHTDALQKVQGTSLNKLLWEQHPTRAKLKRMKRHTSKLYPLCDADDEGDHFLQCWEVNTSAQYTIMRDKCRQKARAVGVPDHLINHTNCLMQGIVLSPKRYPKEGRKAYEQ